MPINTAKRKHLIATMTVCLFFWFGRQAAIENTAFNEPKCPVYQNVDGKPHTEASTIKANLIAQLTSSVRWTSCVQNMIADGADDFTECGPGKALQGMIGRIDKNVKSHGIEE